MYGMLTSCVVPEVTWPPELWTRRGSLWGVLSVQGVNIMQFCKEYNAQTQDKMGQIIPVEITVFEVLLPRLRRQWLAAPCRQECD